MKQGANITTHGYSRERLSVRVDEDRQPHGQKLERI